MQKIPCHCRSDPMRMIYFYPVLSDTFFSFKKGIKCSLILLVCFFLTLSLLWPSPLCMLMLSVETVSIKLCSITSVGWCYFPALKSILLYYQAAFQFKAFSSVRWAMSYSFLNMTIVLKLQTKEANRCILK